MKRDGSVSGASWWFPHPARLAGRWDPFAEFEDLYQRMGQLMGSSFDGLWQPLSWSPLADLSETEDACVAEVELPGVKKDDISVELTGQELVISGEFKESGGTGRTMRKGRPADQFEHRVLLPTQTDPDKVTASLSDGVLTVTVPKSQAEKPHRVQITAS